MRRDIILRIIFVSFLLGAILNSGFSLEAADDKEQSSRPKIGLVLGQTF